MPPTGVPSPHGRPGEVRAESRASGDGGSASIFRHSRFFYDPLAPEYRPSIVIAETPPAVLPWKRERYGNP